MILTETLRQSAGKHMTELTGFFAFSKYANMPDHKSSARAGADGMGDGLARSRPTTATRTPSRATASTNRCTARHPGNRSRSIAPRSRSRWRKRPTFAS